MSYSTGKKKKKKKKKKEKTHPYEEGNGRSTPGHRGAADLKEGSSIRHIEEKKKFLQTKDQNSVFSDLQKRGCTGHI